MAKRGISAGLALKGVEIISGLTHAAKRSVVRALFEAFGPIDACWVIRKVGTVSIAYIRYCFAASARAAQSACDRSEVRVDGFVLAARLCGSAPGASTVQSISVPAATPLPPPAATDALDVGSHAHQLVVWRPTKCAEERKHSRQRSRKRKKISKKGRRPSASFSSYSSRSREKRQRLPQLPTPPPPAAPIRSATAHLLPAPPPAPAPPISGTQRHGGQRSPRRSPRRSLRRSVGQEAPPTLSAKAVASSSSRSSVLEVSNVPVAGENGLVNPEEYLLEMLNPTLEILPDYDKARGQAVLRWWAPAPGVCRLEMQSERLCRSAARVVHGLVFFQHKLETRVAS